MTSASELFYNRRYRLGRTSDYLGNDSLPDRYLHLDINNRRHHHHLHDSSDGETLRRSTPTRRLFHRLSSAERESARLDLRHNWSLSNTANSAENVNSVRGPRVTGNDRLPIAVVHARARLLQRLSAAPPSGNRQRGRVSLGIDDMRHTNFRDEESSESSATGPAEGLLTNLTLQMERTQLSHEENKKPPGLNREAMDRLHVEIFGVKETQTEELESRLLQDCGICLETFLVGDKLIRLPCGHRFHSVCLDPWVRKCGDCPFCRRGIFLN
ncbi:hypothetical protein QN277_001334 [Acacia crassicarpa]|uniref:RING-type domain-containing protein n=1 Tax=Acacia crassicarpa TaxID=499986 RepID=A0AAE1TI79_9FABA|nr:hypothetical protein QN277_001334 [Acacia crassicarpa]